MHDLVGCKGWRAVQEQVNVVRHNLKGHEDAIQSFRLGDCQPTQVFLDRPDKYLPATLRAPVEVENDKRLSFLCRCSCLGDAGSVTFVVQK
jgi:hypothetical protein